MNTGQEGIRVKIGDFLAITRDSQLAYGLVRAITANPHESRDGTWPWATPPEFAVAAVHQLAIADVSMVERFPARPSNSPETVLIVSTPPEEVEALKRAPYSTKATLFYATIEVVAPDLLPEGIRFGK